MDMRKFGAFVAGLAFAVCGLTTAVHAESVVNITLIDKGGMPDLSKSMDLGLAMKGDMNNAPMGVNVSPKSVRRGYVRFKVTNLASSLIHELIVARLADESKPLPFIAGKNMVDVEAVRTLGQVSEINPTKTASLTIEMTPGKYLLYCNLPGHYMAGMWTVIEVK
jgi:uncharacterized cupredoxin-like copper-binding protein